MSLGGVGGGRKVGTTPEPILWPTWQAAVNNSPSGRGFSFEYMGAHSTSADRLARRARPLSAGGKMIAYSSPNGKESSLPAPVSMWEAKILSGSGAPSEASGLRNFR